MTCSNCGHPNMVPKTQDEKMSYGEHSITLQDVRINVCEVCGDGVWDEDSYRRFVEAQADLVCKFKRCI